MKFYRIWALIERDMRKFFRSPALMMASMIFPLVQLIVLGYAFGGKIKGATVAVVDQDHSVESRRMREMFDGVAAGSADVPRGRLRFAAARRERSARGVCARRRRDPRRFLPPLSISAIALASRFIEDNTDQFVSSSIDQRLQQMVDALNAPIGRHAPRSGRAAEGGRDLSVHRVHQVSACRLDRHVDFHRGHDRRRHHVHRRQIARSCTRATCSRPFTNPNSSWA